MQSGRKSYRAGLYMRLSRDDEGAGESSSITTQRSILRAYAQEHGFAVYGEYVDDGWSGTSFERPGFKRMIADIEAGRVDLVLTKDLSRLGRDYITAGQYTEIYFPSKGVRYIAVNDGYDSDSPYTDIVPFKNVINEMYARDTSQKIRSAFSAKMHQGSFIGNFAPYGYQKDPADKNHLVPDPQSSQVVKRIFRMAAEGSGLSQIARCLNGEEIPSPAVYRCLTHPHLDVDTYTKCREWTPSGLSKLLHNVTYLGHTAQGKTKKISFKSDVTVRSAREDWIVVENTHEPLVEPAVFSLVQRRLSGRTCRKTGGFHNLFSGLAVCADCGHSMSAVGTRKKGSAANLVCGGYKRRGGKACTNHAIDYETLYDVVCSALRAELAMTEGERRELAEELRRAAQEREDREDRARELAALRHRDRELDRRIERLYEDRLSGLLSEARAHKLFEKYEGEAAALQRQIAALEQPPDRGTEPGQSEGWAERLVQEYTAVERLTPELLFSLIGKIEVGQGSYRKDRDGRVKQQTVKIRFRFHAQNREYRVSR